MSYSSKILRTTGKQNKSRVCLDMHRQGLCQYMCHSYKGVAEEAVFNVKEAEMLQPQTEQSGTFFLGCAA
jgi:hypothetical protein